MNKSDLTEVLSQELNFPHATGQSIVNTILDAMTEALVKGDNIELRGFCSFTIKHYDSYTGRNPKTGVETKVNELDIVFQITPLAGKSFTCQIIRRPP